MTVTDGFTPHVVRDQINSGPGTFVAGDSFRFEMVDPETKTLLAKIAVQAPTLGTLLQDSLAKGFIDPSLAAALATAARNINEDVVNALLTASRRINEDVAGTLYNASKHINEENATKIDRAATALAGLDVQGMADVAGQVDGTVDSLATIVQLLQHATQDMRQAAAPFRRFTVSLRAAAVIFCVGAIAGAVAYAHMIGR